MKENSWRERRSLIANHSFRQPVAQENLLFDKWHGFVRPCTGNRSYFKPFSQIVNQHDYMYIAGLSFFERPQMVDSHQLEGFFGGVIEQR